MKDAYYFSHDSNARNDLRILPLRMKYGMLGYGIYFGIIEILREANAYQLPNSYEAIAYDLREDASIVKDVIENYNLFKTDTDGNFYSDSLKNRMQHLESIREVRKRAGRKGGLAKAKQLPSSKVKESKVKEKKYITQPILSHFNLVCHKNLSLTKERGQIIEKCFDAGRTEDQIKTAITNFSKDDWADRPKHCDLIYAIGIIKGVDKFDAWFNYKQEPQFRKP